MYFYTDTVISLPFGVQMCSTSVICGFSAADVYNTVIQYHFKKGHLRAVENICMEIDLRCGF